MIVCFTFCVCVCVCAHACKCVYVHVSVCVHLCMYCLKTFQERKCISSVVFYAAQTLKKLVAVNKSKKLGCFCMRFTGLTSGFA